MGADPKRFGVTGEAQPAVWVEAGSEVEVASVEEVASVAEVAAVAAGAGGEPSGKEHKPRVRRRIAEWVY